MGAEHSTEVREVAPEQISHELTEKFALKCYTQLELYCFKQVFKNLADTQSGIEYWTETTLCRFLELPDILNAGSVVYQMTTFLGAFPFPSQAPCIVTREAMLKVVTLLTERYLKVLKQGNDNRLRLLYSSLAVFDRRASNVLDDDAKATAKELAADDSLTQAIKSMEGFAVDEGKNDDYEEDEDDDDLALALLDSLDASQVVGLGEAPRIKRSIIPSDNLLRLVELLLLLAPLDAQQSLSSLAEQVTDARLAELRSAASSILATFGIRGVPGITYRNFRGVVPNSLPHLFDGLSPLFEHFLFERSFDLSKRRQSSASQASPAIGQAPSSPLSPTIRSPVSPGSAFPAPPVEESKSKASIVSYGEILNFATLSQISFILSSEALFGRLHPLFSGAEDGFSMGSFESAVFPWRGPSLFLISGSLLPSVPANSRERLFAESLPSKRFPSSSSESAVSSTENKAVRVTYGAYVPVQWKTSHREPFGSSDAILFQLSPSHDVFRATNYSTDYITFRPAGHAIQHPGISFGSAMPLPGQGKALLTLGPVSLFLDAALEYAVFTHTAAGGDRGSKSSGGSFLPSTAPSRSDASWQDRFEIEALEVYGIGGDDIEARRQRDLEFEEREARLRREGPSNVAGGGHEADRELLRMAGLIGHGEAGGSMG